MFVFLKMLHDFEVTFFSVFQNPANYKYLTL